MQSQTSMGTDIAKAYSSPEMMKQSSGDASLDTFKMLLNTASTAIEEQKCDQAPSSNDPSSVADFSSTVNEMQAIDENQAQIKELKEELVRLSEDHSYL